MKNAHRFGWTVFVVFVLVTCLRVWVGPLPGNAEAYGQIPDAGQQRMNLVQEAQRTNALLADIRSLLVEHTFNVRIASADNPAEQRPDSPEDR